MLFFPLLYFLFPDHCNKNPAESVNAINSNYTLDKPGLSMEGLIRRWKSEWTLKV